MKLKSALALSLLTLVCSFTALSQDDLLSMLEEESNSTDAPVFATFKTMKAVNLHTIEMVKAKT